MQRMLAHSHNLMAEECISDYTTSYYTKLCTQVGGVPKDAASEQCVQCDASKECSTDAQCDAVGMVRRCCNDFRG